MISFIKKLSAAFTALSSESHIFLPILQNVTFAENLQPVYPILLLMLHTVQRWSVICMVLYKIQQEFQR